MVVPIFCGIAHRGNSGTRREQLGVKARENGIVPLVDDAPPEQRHPGRRPSNPRMRFWLSAPPIGSLRPGISFGPEDSRRKRRLPAIVTERQADPVDFEAFRRLGPGERQRLRWRIARSARWPLSGRP
jgi:hypothetical protein